MNSLHQPARVPLAVMAAMVVSLTACLDTPTAVDSSDLWAVSQKKNGNGGSGKPSVGDTISEFRSTTVTFADRDGDRITSDALLRAGDTKYPGPEYKDGECGVWANIGNFNDARFDPDRNYKPGKHGRSCGDARVVAFDFTDGPEEFRGLLTAGTFFNIDSISDMGVSETRMVKAQFNICTTLKFASVHVEHPYDSVWTVTTDNASL